MYFSSLCWYFFINLYNFFAHIEVFKGVFLNIFHNFHLLIRKYNLFCFCLFSKFFTSFFFHILKVDEIFFITLCPCLTDTSICSRMIHKEMVGDSVYWDIWNSFTRIVCKCMCVYTYMYMNAYMHVWVSYSDSVAGAFNIILCPWQNEICKTSLLVSSMNNLSAVSWFQISLRETPRFSTIVS